MKKIIAILLLLLLVSGCASKSGSNNSNKINSLEAFKKIVLDDASKTRKKVEEETLKLRSEIKTKKDYYDNIDKVEENLKNVLKDTRALQVRFREYIYEFGKSLMPLDETKKEALLKAERFLTYEITHDLNGDYNNIVKTISDSKDYYYNLINKEKVHDKKGRSEDDPTTSALYDFGSGLSKDWHRSLEETNSDTERFVIALANSFTKKDEEIAQKAFKKLEEAIEKAKNDVDNIKRTLKNS